MDNICSQAELRMFLAFQKLLTRTANIPQGRIWSNMESNFYWKFTYSGSMIHIYGNHGYIHDLCIHDVGFDDAYIFDASIHDACIHNSCIHDACMYLWRGIPWEEEKKKKNNNKKKKGCYSGILGVGCNCKTTKCFP